MKGGAKKAAASAKAATAKAGTTAKSVALAACGAVKSCLVGVGRGVKAVVELVATSVWFTLETIVYVARSLVLAAAAIVVLAVLLATVAVWSSAAIAFFAIRAAINTVSAVIGRVGDWLRGEGGLQLANILHAGAMLACLCAAIWSLFAVVAVAFPALVAIPVAEAAVLANAACVAAIVGAGFALAGGLIERAQSEVQVVYNPPTRRVLPIDTYPGVVGFAPSAS